MEGNTGAYGNLRVKDAKLNIAVDWQCLVLRMRENNLPAGDHELVACGMTTTNF